MLGSRLEVLGVAFDRAAVLVAVSACATQLVVEAGDVAVARAAAVGAVVGTVEGTLRHDGEGCEAGATGKPAVAGGEAGREEGAVGRCACARGATRGFWGVVAGGAGVAGIVLVVLIQPLLAGATAGAGTLR